MFVSIPSKKQSRFPWATATLIFFLIATYVWSISSPYTTQESILLKWGALISSSHFSDYMQHPLLHSSAWIRLVTAVFLHVDWAHLLGNVVFLLIFGLPSERAMGSLRFLFLFVLGGIISNLCTVFMLSLPEHIVIGASGAVSASIGAYLALFPRARLGIVIPLGLFLEFVNTPASLLIGVWIVLQVLFAYIGPAFGAVAWVAHISGFLFGIGYALLSKPAIAKRLRRQHGY